MKVCVVLTTITRASRGFSKTPRPHAYPLVVHQHTLNDFSIYLSFLLQVQQEGSCSADVGQLEERNSELEEQLAKAEKSLFDLNSELEEQRTTAEKRFLDLKTEVESKLMSAERERLQLESDLVSSEEKRKGMTEAIETAKENNGSLRESNSSLIESNGSLQEQVEGLNAQVAEMTGVLDAVGGADGIKRLEKVAEEAGSSMEKGAAIAKSAAEEVTYCCCNLPYD